jgi:flavin reductase (DIM6/NTAB) family NADH-FMN oxidoreductase RutF
MVMTPQMDRKALRDLSYGLYIVTSFKNDRFNGQIVNTVIQVTSEPPRVAVIINKKNLTHEFIVHSRILGVSVLEETAPMTFFGPFGFRSGRDFDKFAKVNFKKGATGCPLITDHALSVLEAEVIDRVDLGSHTIFIADVLSSEVLNPGRPLTYHYYHEHLKGKSPKNAPTFDPPARETE